MISLPLGSSYTTVFTASVDGIYVFATVDGGADLTWNGSPLPNVRAHVLYLVSGDVIQARNGGGVSLAGVRLGDEL